MWPFTRTTPAAPPPAQAARGRSGDGSVLGDLIEKGIYDEAAGSEPVGHFDPACAPFRTFPNGKSGLMAGQMADQLLQMLREPGVGALLQSMGQDHSQDLAVELGRRLMLGAVRSVLDTFQELASEDAIGKYLIVTTTMPFALKYSVNRPVTIIDEVEIELRLNGLAHLLLRDPDFRDVSSVGSFRARATGLLEARRGEVERLKLVAVQQMQSGEAQT